MRKLLLAGLFISTILAACTPDACEDVNCINGACENGDCICEIGFEGLNCETEQRLAFVATYNVEETCDQGNFSYQLTATAGTENSNDLIINNLGDFNFDVSANVDGNTFVIDHTTNTGATVVGNGTLTGGILTITYALTTTSGQTLNCQTTCTPV